MKYIIIMLFLIGLFSIKPLSLSRVEKLVPKTIKVEVKGHLENPGIFEIANYSTVNDLINKLKLYSDSDLNHYSLNTKLVNNQVISIRMLDDVEMISINSADISELIKLKGIGEAIALRIIDYRNESGGFNKLEELMNVKGIGEKIFHNIKDFITL